MKNCFVEEVFFSKRVFYEKFSFINPTSALNKMKINTSTAKNGT